MRDNTLRTTELLVILVVAIIAAGCGHGGAVVTTANSVLVKCTEVKTTAPIVVAFDARNRTSIDKTLPKTHSAEVCKGRHSLVWFAENGEGLKVKLLDKKGSDVSSGSLNGSVRCGNVVETGTNNIIGSVCMVVTGTADSNGTLYYSAIVTPKGQKDPEEVDPQVIIKDYP